MFFVGKVTPQEKKMFVRKGWEPETIPNDWDGESAQNDNREMVKIYLDISMADWFMHMNIMIDAVENQE